VATKRSIRAGNGKRKRAVVGYALPGDVAEVLDVDRVYAGGPDDEAYAAVVARVYTALHRCRADRRALRRLDKLASELLERDLVPVRRILGALEQAARRALTTKPPAEVAREIADLVHEQCGVTFDDGALTAIEAEVSNHVARARQPRAIVSAVLHGAGYAGDLWAGDRKRKQRRTGKA
jgi:hypothetical protein